jgi:hypothetical protein
MTRTESSTDITLRVAELTALCCSVIAIVYTVTQREPVPIVTLFMTSGPVFAAVLWLQRDAQRTGVGAVHDWGYFLLLAWPVIIPWYAFKTRGVKGWRLMAALFGLIATPYISALLTAVVVRLFSAGS